MPDHGIHILMKFVEYVYHMNVLRNRHLHFRGILIYKIAVQNSQYGIIWISEVLYVFVFLFFQYMYIYIYSVQKMSWYYYGIVCYSPNVRLYSSI